MSFLNDKQSDLAAKLTWPSTFQGGVAYGYDKVLRVNGLTIILYPSGKCGILTVDDSDMAREAEAVVRDKFKDYILDHVGTYYRDPVRQLQARRDRWQACVDYNNGRDPEWDATLTKRINKLDAAIAVLTDSHDNY